MKKQMKEQLTYARFHTREDARLLLDVLSKLAIPYTVEEAAPILDKIYVGEQLDPMIAVKIPADQFERVNKAMIEAARPLLDELNPDYYLFSFSEQELKDVLSHPDEWNYLDQALAEKLLREQQITFEPAEIRPIAVKAIAPMRLALPWIVVGYLLSIYYFPVGVFLYLGTRFAKRTLADGARIPMFDEYTRRHAFYMLVVNLLVISYFVARIVWLRNN
ncbi:MAG: hypothetical protein P0Y53_02405 [Candidatus Pseudobacter hemicellulosilyticus]|uniref:Uncharacterized protein n=1 Tax=Candidatus Pseudobacter hemicellulosilyticus TaxID=3121375 RepID=A0AAJ5WT77_9BACT|nr:MAG: hypothetical protein P0Y53_02405 [Pseudobacter sp.]